MAKASDLTKKAKSLIGIKEGSAEHKALINLYNSFSPLPRGYKMKSTDSWCAMFGSVLAISCKATNIIPVECSCEQWIKLAKNLGIWIEDESITPKEGYYILYDWNDSGVGDNKGWSDHIGYVEKVENGVITVIEGNYNDSVKRRTIKVNAKTIRGYAAPKYDAESTATNSTKGGNIVNIELNVLKKGSKGEQVKTLQRLLIAMGYSCGSAGVDGSFGSATDAAVRKYQKNHSLAVDGSVGKNTWTSILK